MVLKGKISLLLDIDTRACEVGISVQADPVDLAELVGFCCGHLQCVLEETTEAAMHSFSDSEKVLLATHMQRAYERGRENGKNVKSEEASMSVREVKK
jgi:hypothetical protein